MQTHHCQGHDMNGHLEIFQNVNRVYCQMIALHVILSFPFFPTLLYIFEVFFFFYDNDQVLLYYYFFLQVLL